MLRQTTTLLFNFGSDFTVESGIALIHTMCQTNIGLQASIKRRLMLTNINSFNKPRNNNGIYMLYTFKDSFGKYKRIFDRFSRSNNGNDFISPRNGFASIKQKQRTIVSMIEKQRGIILPIVNKRHLFLFDFCPCFLCFLSHIWGLEFFP